MNEPCKKKKRFGVNIDVFLFSITRSSTGRKPSALKYCNGKQESGTSNRGNSLVIYFSIYYKIVNIVQLSFPFAI